MKNRYKTIILFALGMIYSYSVFAQQTLKGTVKSKEDHQPLVGVSIIIKGTIVGAISGADGNFSLNVNPKDVLSVSYIGYKTQEIAVNNRTTVDILLEEDALLMDEVVVVGYGYQKKSDITGSVSSVKPANLQNTAITRIDEALQGQVAGVEVVNNDASPNASVAIRIRGVNSINARSNPLVIIDGMQGGSMSSVHPNDIGSIEILKDASATAIYGSRGAGGVILITTKKGVNKKPAITYNVFGSMQQIGRKMDLMNASEYSQYINENRRVRGLNKIFDADQFAYFQNNSTDWQDEIFRTGYTQNHHLSISGKSERIAYTIAGDYFDSKGSIITSKYQKASLRSNLSIDLHEKIKLNLNTCFDSSKDSPVILNSRAEYGSPVYAALNFAPTRPIYESDGKYSQPGGGYGSNTEYNPVALAKEQTNLNRENSTIINPEIVIQLFKNLRFQSSLYYSSGNGEYDWYYTEKVLNGDESTRSASIGNGRWSSFQNTNMLTFEDLFAEKHRLAITAVLEQQKSESNSNSAGANGFFTNEKLWYNLSLGKETYMPSSYKKEQALLSYMGRVSYTFSDKYSATLTMRADGASVFAKNNKWGYFPSAGLAWNISNEKFMEQYDKINNLKLRLSYGVVGNQAIGPYQSLDMLSTGAYYSFDGEKVSPGVALSTSAGNSDLKWETTRQWNGGIDLSMFKGRLSFTADIYRKITSDLLFEKQLKLASGQSTQLTNVGKIQNQGIELLIGGIPVLKKDFEWNTNVTYAANRSKVLSLNEGVSEMILGGGGMPGFSEAVWLEVGQPIGLVKGFRYDGVWKSDEKILAGAYGVNAGSPKYYDKNNDGKITSDDRVTIAKTLPDFTCGWSNSLKYKDFTLHLLFVGVYDNDVINLGRYMIEGDNDGTGRNLLNRWTPENENTNIPGHDILGNQRNSSQWVEDGSYFRLKTLTFGYNLSSKLTKKLGVDQIRVYVTGSNLFTITNYTGYDPESNNAGGYAPFTGFDVASYPSQRKYSLGLDITF